MHNLRPIHSIEDIPTKYQNTPIGLLLEFHNLNKKPALFEDAQLLIGMCIDNRKQLNLPENFAYVLRSPGANFDQDAFAIAYAVFCLKKKNIALIGHNDCGMVQLAHKRETFLKGLEEVGNWEKGKAIEFYESNLIEYGLENEIDILIRQATEFRGLYPKVITVPMLYRVEDKKLFLIENN